MCICLLFSKINSLVSLTLSSKLVSVHHSARLSISSRQEDSSLFATQLMVMMLSSNYTKECVTYYHRMGKPLTFGSNPFKSESSGSLQIGHLTGVISLWRRCTASAQLWFVCSIDYGPIDPQQECIWNWKHLEGANGMATTHHPNVVSSWRGNCCVIQQNYSRTAWWLNEPIEGVNLKWLLTDTVVQLYTTPWLPQV